MIIEGPFHQAEEIKEFSDIHNDLKRIAQAERHLHSNSGREAARQLNYEKNIRLLISYLTSLIGCPE